MEVEALMLGQPFLDLRVFVGGVVVADHVDLEFFRDLTVDDTQELQKLDVAMLRQTGADHDAGEHVERGEQGGGAVALVVVGHRASSALLHRQRRLGAVQGLDLRLLIHAQHHGLLGRVQVQAHDVDQLLLETRIMGELEGLHQMRFEPPRRPDPLHRRRAHPDLVGHRPTRPMRLAFRFRAQGQLHDLGDLLVGN